MKVKICTPYESTMTDESEEKLFVQTYDLKDKQAFRIIHVNIGEMPPADAIKFLTAIKNTLDGARPDGFAEDIIIPFVNEKDERTTVEVYEVSDE